MTLTSDKGSLCPADICLLPLNVVFPQEHQEDPFALPPLHSCPRPAHVFLVGQSCLCRWLTDLLLWAWLLSCAPIPFPFLPDNSAVLPCLQSVHLQLSSTFEKALLSFKSHARFPYFFQCTSILTAPESFSLPWGIPFPPIPNICSSRLGRSHWLFHSTAFSSSHLLFPTSSTPTLTLLSSCLDCSEDFWTDFPFCPYSFLLSFLFSYLINMYIKDGTIP